jgi:transaldolase
VKLFLATDALDDVRWAAERALIDGVVLPDAALRDATSPEDAMSWLAEFARAVAMPVFVALSASSAEDAAAEAERLGRAADTVVIQMPFTEPYIPLLHRLAQSGVRVAATFVGSASQALLAARTGADFVFIDVDRLDAAGADGARVVQDARRVCDVMAAESHLVAVFPAAGSPLVACALAGADAAVIGAATLRAMLAYPYTDQSLPDGARRSTHGERLRVTSS